ncbi:MAG: hypothetical protein R3F31_25895 [Verrucomicrobiales bacterium]|nr:hypothetical protein [Verrucomicrobiae bacterium]
MTYELWHSAIDGCYTFIPSGPGNSRAALEPDALLIWTVEAENWEEAQTKKHHYLGWEPYIPMEEDVTDAP